MHRDKNRTLLHAASESGFRGGEVTNYYRESFSAKRGFEPLEGPQTPHILIQVGHEA